TATARVTVSGTANGQQSGLIVMGYDYCRLTVEKQDSDFVIKQIICRDSHKRKGETSETIATFPADRIIGQGSRRTFHIDLYLRVKVSPQGLCTFAYSRNGKRYIDCGTAFQAREGHWIGARIGFFSVQPKDINRGWMDIDWFRITPFRK
ncbi:MAG: glycoside hydrolase, partial [Muribaculaceae bacterium]|nr:glycoside hydrolase [Muribaculaceae bacterium]